MKPRILVIRGGAIGDFILTLPAIRLLRENFPEAQLEILGYEHIIELARGRFYAHATRSIEYGPMAGFFIPNSILAPDLVEYFASFQQVVSYLFDPDLFFENNLRRAGVKNILFCPPTPGSTTPCTPPSSSRVLCKSWPSSSTSRERNCFPRPQTTPQARQFLGESTGPVIALHPGSGSPRKNWPATHWAALARWLREYAPESRLLLVGGEADAASLATVQAAIPGQNVLSAEHLPLPLLAAVLERCRLFLGHDSGISHLAAAVDTPCLLLFGPDRPGGVGAGQFRCAGDYRAGVRFGPVAV
ncbi:MAG: glycosyltransferase family 9 protein [Chthoniobacter sp.]